MPSTKNSSVAIIIVNWNGYVHTRNCLHSLQRVTFPGFQIVLVDNASTDGSVEKLKNEFDQANYLVNEKNLGFTGGNNVGIQYALKEGFEHIMLLNNDTEVEPDFLDHLYQKLEEDHQTGAVQPLMYFLHDRNKVWNAGGRYNAWTGSSMAIKSNPQNTAAYPTHWITGCCILVRSALIKRIGLLNDLYFAYFEDVDWSLRMQEQGYKLVVVPESVIYHEAGASSKSKTKSKEGKVSPKVHFLHTRNQFFQLRNHVGFPHGLIAWPYQLGKALAISLYFLLRNRKKKLKAVLSGIKNGLFQKCR